MNPKTKVLCLVAPVAFVCGFVPSLLDTSSASLAAASLFMQTLLPFAWYRHDALERGFRRSALLDAGVIVCVALALPYYLLRTRGVVRGALATVLLIALLLGSAAAALCGVVTALVVLEVTQALGGGVFE